MELLTSEQCAAWAAQHTFPGSGKPREAGFEAAGYRSVEFEIPADAGRRIALARLLWEAGDRAHQASLFWVTQWSVWSSGEHLPLALALRRAAADARPLHEAPGHLFRPGEDDLGVSFFALALLFLWDAWLLSESGELAIFVSHDEYGVALARSLDASLPLEQRLAVFRGPAA
jgi:hypothetical protein